MLPAASSHANAYPSSLPLRVVAADARPSKYGLTNVADACVVFDQLTTGYIMVNGTMQPATLVSTCPNPMQYFFW